MLRIASGAAQQPQAGTLGGLDLDQLGRVQITSASRKPELISQAAAAIFVITRDDIRRSGSTSLPEALRLAPGLQVARVGTREWAISSRGFNDQSTNKLLVLIDGRAVYSPLFAGVYWDIQDIPLGEIERIEVILGPGATLWGANAVNGVINVIRRNAEDTPGGAVALTGGTEEHLAAVGRYGARIGTNGAIRVYGKYVDRDPSALVGSRDASDDWSFGLGGARFDQILPKASRLTLQSEVYGGSGGEPQLLPTLTPPFVQTTDEDVKVGGGHLLARWSRELSDRSQVSFQSYYDRSTRDQPDFFGRLSVDILDFDFQHRFGIGRRHDIVWGLGYRLVHDDVTGALPIAFDPSDRTTNLLTGFLQDDIELRPDRWFLTLGTKLEHNDFSGFEFQPNIRLLWRPAQRHTFWSAVSRAVRSPSRVDSDVRELAQVIPGPTPTLLLVDGSPDFGSEELISYELGYRSEVSRALSVDVALYYNHYDNLRSVRAQPDPASPPVLRFVVSNGAEGETYGGTIAGTWKVAPSWRLRGSYTYLHMFARTMKDHPGEIADVRPGRNPTHQASLQSSFNLTHAIDFDLDLRYVDSLPLPRIPGYVEADARLGWAIGPDVTVSIVGQDLLHHRHAEFPPAFFSLEPREIERRGYAKVVWRF
ncbi:MAG: TonB-dependent receptor plug domain-containing protein [Gemmatimonadales bacterium]